MTELARTAVWCFVVFAGLCGARAQTAPGDSLRGPPGPPGPGQSTPDSLVAAATIGTIAPVPPERFERVLRLGMEAVAGDEEILELASYSVGEALEQDPAVNLLRRGWHGMPQYLSIRGARAGEIVYRLDGIPVSDSQLEDLDLNQLPLAGIEGGEIIKGGLSSIHGSGAIGGVLEIASMTAMPTLPESEITAWWGSHDSRAVSLRFNRRITDRLGILGTYENLGSGGWIDNTSSGSEKFSGKVTASLGAQTRVDVAGYRYKGDFEWPDSCPTFFDTSPADQRDEREFLKASFLTGGGRKLHLDVFRLWTSMSYASAETSYIHEGTLYGVELGLSWQASDSAVTSLGAGYRNRRIESSSLGDRASNDLYAYASSKRRYRKWSIQGSVRVARNSGFRTQAGLGLAARFAVGRDIFLFGRLDRSYRFPSFHVLYARGEKEPADARIGTESSIGVELGVLLTRRPLSLRVAAFRRDADGVAHLSTDAGCRTYLYPDTKTDVTGCEVAIELISWSWVDAILSYTLCVAENDTGEQLAYIPKEVIAARTGLRRRFSEHISAGITFAGRYVSKVEAGARFEPCESEPICVESADLAGYLSGLANAYIEIDRATVFLKIQNIADDDIRTGWGQPKLPSRSYEFGISALLVD